MGKIMFTASPERASMLEKAWRVVCATVGLAGDPWKAVAGPAGAVLATLRRLGWIDPAPAVWADHNEGVLYLEDVAPRIGASNQRRNAARVMERLLRLHHVMEMALGNAA